MPECNSALMRYVLQNQLPDHDYVHKETCYICCDNLEQSSFPSSPLPSLDEQALDVNTTVQLS